MLGFRMERAHRRQCCGIPLTWSLGRRRDGRIMVELFRCRYCEAVHSYVRVPTWISAVSRCVAGLRAEIAESAYRRLPP
jgi:hypothetical protein